MTSARREERGVGTVLTAGIAFVLLTVTALSCMAVAWFAVVRRAEHVAELAALAGAGAAVDGVTVCTAAEAAAAHNDARLSACEVRGEGVDVVVEVGVAVALLPRLPGMPEVVERRATAGTL